MLAPGGVLRSVERIRTLIGEDVRRRAPAALILVHRGCVGERRRSAVASSAATTRTRKRHIHLLRAASRPRTPLSRDSHRIASDCRGRLGPRRARDVVARSSGYGRSSTSSLRRHATRGPSGAAKGRRASGGRRPHTQAVENRLDLRGDGDMVYHTDRRPVCSANVPVLGRIRRAAAAWPARVLVARAGGWRGGLGPLQR